MNQLSVADSRRPERACRREGHKPGYANTAVPACFTCARGSPRRFRGNRISFVRDCPFLCPLRGHFPRDNRAPSNFGHSTERRKFRRACPPTNGHSVSLKSPLFTIRRTSFQNGPDPVPGASSAIHYYEFTTRLEFPPLRVEPGTPSSLTEDARLGFLSSGAASFWYFHRERIGRWPILCNIDIVMKISDTTRGKRRFPFVSV